MTASIAIRMAGYQGPSSIHTRAAAHFGEKLREALGDRVSFELIPSVLDHGHRSGELPTMVETGELTACYMSSVRFVQDVPELAILELPFVVRSRERAIAALDGELGSLFTERMHARTPFRVLGYWDNGIRHITNRVRPIRTPRDCKGLRIRTQMSALAGETFAALGFEPVPVDIKDFVEQIGSGQLDAQENPLTNIYHFGVQHYHRYITLTAHFFGASAFICNAGQYASWPADVREAVDRAGFEATRFQRRLAAAEDEQVLARVDPAENDLIRLTDSERAAFVRAVEPVVAKYRARLGPKLFEYLA